MLFLIILATFSSLCLLCICALDLHSYVKALKHLRRTKPNKTNARVAIVMWQTPKTRINEAQMNTLSAFLSNPNMCLRVGVVDDSDSTMQFPGTGDVAMVVERRDIQGVLPAVLGLAAVEACPAEIVLALDNCAMPSSLDIARVLELVDTENAYGFLFRPAPVERSLLGDFVCRLFCDLVPLLFATFGAKGLVPHAVCAPREKVMKFASDTYARHSINIASAIFRQFPNKDCHLVPLFLNVSCGFRRTNIFSLFLKHLSVLWSTSRQRYLATLFSFCALPMALVTLVFAHKGWIFLLVSYFLKAIFAVSWKMKGKKPGQVVADLVLEVLRDILAIVFMFFALFKSKTTIAGKVYSIRNGGLLVED